MEQTQLEIDQLRKDIKLAKLQFQSVSTMLPDVTQFVGQQQIPQSSLASTMLQNQNNIHKPISTKSDLIYQQQSLMLDHISKMASAVSKMAKHMTKIDKKLSQLEKQQVQNETKNKYEQDNTIFQGENEQQKNQDIINQKLNGQKLEDERFMQYTPQRTQSNHLFEYFKDLPINKNINKANIKQKSDQISDRQKQAFKNYVKKRVYDLQDTDLE
ncbi:hypothetical protein SS50377_22328 [Spironucleus salmonicida]|uniref:Uncharacterized protein n=1 Tax=Spironucleus salmonicida TaxID=348837 RepID=V6LD76_9EUKA|nr:hypothetical protein SS50377_22328 [Spironucleus salmonicida]|eukprot:EST42178.1 Hypothetical protein SS50377_18484 [Spironucleus salmonicida]